SVPQMMVLGGELREKNIHNHPDRNKLLKAFGAKEDVVECRPSDIIPVEEGQAFLLCSDGFWELILEKEMTKTLRKSRTVDEWMNAMAEIIVKRQSEKNENADNFTAIAVWI
ncbi:MAG: serine/threonine-protein phosphatase, partial [Oscillospiraceae bacterium]|nr:serine/threonine-protein phosphatase [Oscillospiraceae bacterium]